MALNFSLFFPVHLSVPCDFIPFHSDFGHVTNFGHSDAGKCDSTRDLRSLVFTFLGLCLGHVDILGLAGWRRKDT